MSNTTTDELAPSLPASNAPADAELLRELGDIATSMGLQWTEDMRNDPDAIETIRTFIIQAIEQQLATRVEPDAPTAQRQQSSLHIATTAVEIESDSSDENTSTSNRHHLTSEEITSEHSISSSHDSVTISTSFRLDDAPSQNSVRGNDYTNFKPISRTEELPTTKLASSKPVITMSPTNISTPTNHDISPASSLSSPSFLLSPIRVDNKSRKLNESLNTAHKMVDREEFQKESRLSTDVVASPQNIQPNSPSHRKSESLNSSMQAVPPIPPRPLRRESSLSKIPQVPQLSSHLPSSAAAEAFVRDQSFSSICDSPTSSANQSIPTNSEPTPAGNLKPIPKTYSNRISEEEKNRILSNPSISRIDRLLVSGCTIRQLLDEPSILEQNKLGHPILIEMLAHPRVVSALVSEVCLPTLPTDPAGENIRRSIAAALLCRPSMDKVSDELFYSPYVSNHIDRLFYLFVDHFTQSSVFNDREAANGHVTLQSVDELPYAEQVINHLFEHFWEKTLCNFTSTPQCKYRWQFYCFLLYLPSVSRSIGWFAHQWRRRMTMLVMNKEQASSYSTASGNSFNEARDCMVDFLQFTMVSCVKLIGRLYRDITLNEQIIASLTTVYSYLFKCTLLPDTICDEFDILADLSEAQAISLREFVRVIHIKLNRIVKASLDTPLLDRARSSLKLTLTQAFETQCAQLKTLTQS